MFHLKTDLFEEMIQIVSW